MPPRTPPREDPRIPKLVLQLVQSAPVPMVVLASSGEILFANTAFGVLLDTDPSMLIGTPAPFSAGMLKGLLNAPQIPAAWETPDGDSRMVVAVRLEHALGAVVLGPTAPISEEALRQATERLHAVEAAMTEEGSASLAVREIIALLTIEGAPFNQPVGQIADVVQHVIESRMRDLAAARIQAQILEVARELGSVHSETAVGAINEVITHLIPELKSRPDPRALRVAVVGPEAGIVAVRLTHNGEPKDPAPLQQRASLYGVQVGLVSAGPGLGVTYVVTLPRV